MNVAVRYQWEVGESAGSPITPGKYEIVVVEGGTYRNIASRRKYTITELDPEKGELVYRYTRADGEQVEREGKPGDLAVVEAVGDTPGGIVDREVTGL